MGDQAVTLALRPFLMQDTPLLARMFRASIEHLAEDDYSHGQLEAWMSLADDELAFGKGLEQGLTLIALLDKLPAGFISLKGADKIEMLYVAPGMARRGVGRFLLDAIEKIAGARGASRLSVDATDNACPFFEAQLYLVERRNTMPINDEWLGTTTLYKFLASSQAVPDQPAPSGPLH
jgi:putative acetyltransferase